LALLTLAVGAQAAAFAARAYDCRFMRMTASERPGCCSLSARDRFTRPGGDCCKHLVVEEATPATGTDFVHTVPPSLPATTPAQLAVPARVAHLRAVPPRAVQRPPPIPIPTETIVLRV